MIGNKKRILFIAPQPFFEVRGTPIAVKDMLNILKENFDIDLVTYPQGKPLPLDGVVHHRCFSFGVKTVKIGPSFGKLVLDVSLFFKSLSLLLLYKYDYIHAVEEAALFGILFKKIKKVKLVFDMDSIMSEQVANSKFKFATSLFKIIEKLIIKNSDLILAVSINFKDYCKSIDKNCNFVVIFDVPQIEKVSLPEDLRNKFIQSNRKKVLYVGNGEKYQGVEFLVGVAKKMPDLDFYIVGTGREGVEGNVTYISKVNMEYVWGIMQLVDVLVSPRISGTNTPMKIYTYMASGKPIVATKIPAHDILIGKAILSDVTDTSFSESILNLLVGESTYESNKTSEFVDEHSIINLSSIIIYNYEKI